MKNKGMKLLLLLTGILILNFASLSQNTGQKTDSITVAVVGLRNIVADAKQKPVLLEQIMLLKNDIRLLDSRIMIKDSIIAEYVSKDYNNNSIVGSLRREKQLLLDDRQFKNEQLDTYEKLLRKEKRKHRWAKIGWFTTIALGTYLYISK